MKELYLHKKLFQASRIVILLEKNNFIEEMSFMEEIF